MDKGIDPLAQRLHLLESAMPGSELPPGVFDTHPKQRQQSRRLGILAGLVAAMLLSGAAGAAVHQVMTGVTGHPGVFSPNGGLACSPIQQMTPLEAGNALAELGYEVTWQVEYRAIDPLQNATTMSSTAPTDGYIIDGVAGGNHLLLVVERGPAAQPSQGC